MMFDAAPGVLTPHEHKDIGARARRFARAAGLGDIEVSFAVVDDDDIAALNARFRHKSGATDVLSFPADLIAGGPAFLGDVIVSAPTARRQAAACGHPFAVEVVALLCHGVVHLLGYDHERGPREAVAMAEIELSLLAAAGIEPGVALIGRAL